MTEKDTNITTPTLLHPVRSALRKWRSTWIVLVVGLMITTAATLYMKSSVENIANLEFTSHCNEITNIITERLDDHARILLSGAALFNAFDIVTREEWRIFNKAQKVEKQLPGIQGIGFSLLIPRAELTRHIRKIRREGFPQYNLRPDGVREIYSSIVYLEPFSGRNLRAFGYDMLSEPVRRSAMERARDTDTAALSGKVVLVQETSADIQAGTLMYVPVYRKGMPIETIEQRRAAIYGWVYSPYRMNDLMQGISGNRNLEEGKQLRLQVFDGTQPSIQSMLYDSHSAGDNALRANARFTRQIPVDFNGQPWTLRFTKTGGGFSTVDYSSVWLTMFGGILITLLLFSLIRALLDTRAKVRIAENLTAELLVSEKKYQYLFNNAQVALFRTRTSDGKLLEINERYAQMAGYSNVNDCMTEFDVSDAWVDPDGRKILVGILQENGFVTDYETSIIRRDGTHIWILFSATIFPEEGFIEGSIVDITVRKRAEEALQDKNVEYEALNEKLRSSVEELQAATEELQAQNEKLQQQEVALRETNAYLENLINYANAPIIVWNPQFCITRFNHAFEFLTGRSEAEVIGQSLEILFPTALAGDSMALIRKTLTGERWETVEIKILHRDESVRTVLWNSATLFTPDGQTPIATIAQGQDITDRKQVEMALKSSEAEKNAILNGITTNIALVNKDLEILWANKAAANSVNKKMEEVIGHYCYSFWGDNVKPCVNCPTIKAFQTGKSEHLIVQTPDGRIWDESGEPILDVNGNVTAVVEIAQDITDRKKSEEKISASLREKETLLKEIHHRVKNNLQIISSLLNLQSRNIGDEKLEGIFRECQDRITAMASVHSLLYKSQNFAEVDFGEYIRETASLLLRSYKTGSSAISLAIHAENVLLPIDTAIPCGLIINELVTNSLKYAFTGIRNGEIKIDMNRTENVVKLIFEDNGIGFPEDVDFGKRETLGLKLVHLLIKQLDGSIKQDTNNGTRYVFTFETRTLQEI